MTCVFCFVHSKQGREEEEIVKAGGPVNDSKYGEILFTIISLCKLIIND